MLKLPCLSTSPVIAKPKKERYLNVGLLPGMERSGILSRPSLVSSWLGVVVAACPTTFAACSAKGLGSVGASARAVGAGTRQYWRCRSVYFVRERQIALGALGCLNRVHPRLRVQVREILLNLLHFRTAGFDLGAGRTVRRNAKRDGCDATAAKSCGSGILPCCAPAIAVPVIACVTMFVPTCTSLFAPSFAAFAPAAPPSAQVAAPSAPATFALVATRTDAERKSLRVPCGFRA